MNTFLGLPHISKTLHGSLRGQWLNWRHIGYTLLEKDRGWHLKY